jgi:hypothetical protein
MEQFQQEHEIRLPSWGVAFALMDNQMMLVDVGRATTAWNTLEKVIPHELSHLLLGQRIVGVRMPTWFIEGLAVWQSHEWSVLDNWRLMEAVWTKKAPSLWQITERLPADEPLVRDAYRVAYMGFVTLFDEEMQRLPFVLDEIAAQGAFATAFELFWGEREVDYYVRFATALEQRYRSRLLIFQAGPLFSIVAVLFLFVYLRIKVRNRRKLKRMEQSDRGLWFDER